MYGIEHPWDIYVVPLVSVELYLFAYILFFFFASEIKSRVIEDRPTPEVYTSLPFKICFKCELIFSKRLKGTHIHTATFSFGHLMTEMKVYGQL